METEHAGSENAVSRIPHIDHIADTLASTAHVRNVYGAPIERNGTTVVPVAAVRYGFGGRRSSRSGDGGHGGAKVQVSPVGYIEMCRDDVAFRSIRTPRSPLRAIGFALAAMIAARGLASLLPPLTKRRWLA